MKRLFVVIRSRGPAWKASHPLEEQAEWIAHASFMDALTAEGFVLLGGPMEGTSDVLLVVRAGSPGEIADRLSADPWSRNLLTTKLIAPWTLRLGALE